MTELYQIRIGFRSQPHVLQLDFVDLIKANAVRESLTTKVNFPDDNKVEVVDDGGGRVYVDRSDIMFVWFVDGEKAEDMKRVQAVANQVSQIRGQVALSTSPDVKSAVTAASIAGVNFGPPPGAMNGQGRH